MTATRSFKTLTVLASAALIATSLLGGTADAKKKKKKPKPPPAPPACAPFAPGEAGAEAPTTIVTDAATAEAPVVVEVETEMGLADDLGLGEVDMTSSVFHNIQVDSANASAGLYVKIEFADRHDYDLYLLNAEGATAANSGVFNPVPEGASLPIGIGGGSPEGGWEAGSDYESVTGINTADCGGYTAQIKSYLTPGGTVTMSTWLGEALVEPQA